MLRQYNILNRCLLDLKKSDMQDMKRLKLEVQLIQTKQLLLNRQVEYRVAGVVSSEEEFNGMYDLFRDACRTNANDNEVDGALLRLLEIKRGLECHLESGDRPSKLNVDKYRRIVAKLMFNLKGGPKIKH
jgi:hypothetical protein